MAGTEIRSITARQVYTNRGNPGVEAVVTTENGATGRAMCTSGISIGTHEIHFDFDGGERFRGKGVLGAVRNVNEIIAPALKGLDAANQRLIDRTMLDIVPDAKAKLGGNATAAVSAAVLKAGAAALGIPLYRHIGGANAMYLPVPGVAMVAGHERYGGGITTPGGKPTMSVMCFGFDTFADASYACWDIHTRWAEKMDRRFGGAPNIRDFIVVPEGVFKSDEEIWEAMTETIIEAGYEGVKLMKKHVQRTMIPGVVSDLGGFGGLFAPDLAGMKEPVLVSGTDGVGTKQRIAQLVDKHDTVGIDCVAMCVNDIICCGAKPIFFLDYIAIGKNEPEKVATLVSGVAEGCVQSGCALIGGETAEHPGTMSADDYDLAGFAVGIVDRAKIIDHDRMRPGDVVIALTSSGIHSNGYSLVRKVFNVEHADLGAYVDELGCTLGEELLRPTKIYVKPVLAAMDVADVHGVSHITGGGFYENIPRCIPDGLCAKIDKSALRTPPIFSMLQRMGSIPEHDMFNTYNMGVGMTMIVAKDDADKALAALKENGQDAYVIGEVVSGEEKVALC